MTASRHRTPTGHWPSPARLALAAAFLAAAFVVVSALAGDATPWELRLAAAVPSAVVAVAVAAVVTWSDARRLRAWVSGLASAGAVLVVDSFVAVTMGWATSQSADEAWRAVPLHAALTLAVLTALTAARWRPVEALMARAAWRTAAVTSVAAALVGTMLVGPASTTPASADTIAPAAQVCRPGEQQRNYAISAITADVPFNRWGDTLRSARIFALDQDIPAISNWWRPLAKRAADDPAQNRRLRPRPLVLRANEGECLRITLTNRMSATPVFGLPANPRVGIQAAGVVMDVRGDGGARAGFNADPTVGIGESTTYFWRVPAQEGLFLFQDMATPAGGEHDAGSRGIGLYGGLAVEPAGSVWTDPRSGAVLSGNGNVNSTYTAVRNQSGELYVEADIHPPDGPSFRESVQLSQDEVPNIGMGFNYGSEPLSQREAKACPDCVGEETWLSSWPYGDPALVKLASGRGPWMPNGKGDRQEAEDCGLKESCFISNVFHTYTGDPTKIRFGLSGMKETHVFHLHAHQWLADPRDNAVTGDGPDRRPESTTIDSQSYGPGEAYTADLLYGAGSQNGTFGDSIFHCHLYPHFAEGFWSLMRTHDVRVDGSTATPDGVKVRPLIPLPGSETPPAATPDNPGYPGMIPGTYGYRAPQPPDMVTEGGADGTPERPAPRLVAGQTIDEAKLAVERAVVARHNPDGNVPRGAPYADPCPEGAREVDYDVTVLQRDLVYNDAGHHDPQARFMVLTKDVPAILDGTKEAEPLFIRVNAGDCINFSLTNMSHNWTGGDAFQRLAQTNMVGGHVHLVKFDVTASDGGSNGWNYQQAAFTREQADLQAQQAAGEVTCTPSATFYGGTSTGCRLETPASWTPPEDSTGQWGQTIHERWYADYELRTAFTHDHHFPALVQNHGLYGSLIVEPSGFDVRDPKTGAFLQPVNNPANGPVCGARCEGGAVGASADLIGPGANDDYREYGLAVADFVSLVEPGGDPRNPADVVNPPVLPEHFPSHDPGTFSINFKNAPLSERTERAGKPVDPAHKFSSWVFGDPETPVLEGYARDNVKLRVVQGSHEEQHMFQVHGLRWLEEPDDPGSPLVNAQTIGISEAFNAEMPGFDCKSTDTPCRGDYLYGNTTPEGLWNGMWGIMRVHGAATPNLLALPDNAPRAATGTAPVPASRQAPPPARNPGVTCPTGAPVKNFDVVAMATTLTYNEWGDKDPKGLIYALAQDEAAIRSGQKKPEPLVIRANAGDCVRVTLRNALPESYGQHVNGVGGDLRMVEEPARGTPMGTRVSLHPQLLRHDVRLSDGAAIGFNPDSTVGIGETISYEWYADTELGGTNLVDYGDVRGHRHHGLFAALNVEPRHATYHDPATGAPLASGTVADIRVPGQSDFRELTLLYEDGLDLRTAAGAEIRTPQPPGDAGEPLTARANHGEKGVNYANAPLHRRLGAPPSGFAGSASSAAWSTVFSSVVHGDPRTPIVRSYAGDQIRVRTMNGSGKSAPGYFGGFQLDGASWRQEPYDVDTELVGNQGNIGPGRAINAHVSLPAAGDHLWSAATSLTLPGGMWGLARVYPAPGAGGEAGFVPTPLRRNDNPYAAGSAPIMPLERAGTTAFVFDDADGDGTRDAGENPRRGVTVRLLRADGTEVASATTGADGSATFSPTAGVYDLQVVAPDGAAVVGGTKRRVDLREDGAWVEVAFGLAGAAALTAVVFEDLDGDGIRDDGESGVAGWTVSADGATALPDVVTGEDGTAAFPGATTGSWTLTLQPRSGWSTTTTVPVTVAVGPDGATAELGVSRAAGLRVIPVDDADGDGTADDGEPRLRGLTVEAVIGEQSVRAVTDGEGALLDTGGADATVRVLRPDSTAWACTGALATTPAGTQTVACGPDGTLTVPGDATELVVLGEFPDGVITTTLFQDADRDGRKDPGEGPLADWPVALQRGEDHVEIARATTGPNGRARFAVAPGAYDVVPLPPDEDVAWENTMADYHVEVARGGHVESTGGWLQPGTISVGVFHDRDRNGTQDDYDEPLAEREVRLYDAAGKLLATAVTEGTGRAAFPVQAGSGYAVEAAAPTGWEATAPTAEGAVLTRVDVRAPADGTTATAEVGHYNTVDRTAPVAPVMTPPGGVLDRPTTVELTAESGAQIRYTLDGTTPTATRGMVYVNPVRISTDRVLQAVAIDPAGNVSPVAAAAFDLPWTGASATLPPASWAATTGALRGAGYGDADDGKYVAVASARLARQTADVTATMALPENLRAPAALNVSVSLKASLRNTRVRLQWYDVATDTWRALAPAYTQGLYEGRVDLDLPNATRAVAADGTVQIRVIADNAQPFDLSVDQLNVTAVNR
ncbi:SdrD B-like domain-containing protein [Georgenia yuyongxinii]|uniref:Uncharacterized protein n=1 Tax=Georgenia yuyongxinii TaxID=2589797 RepID=A0A552WQE0_9MICO|nr:SdrD B-like domain-containing protein [Georgenia yuyongxinii]TRW44713.1 hypothetical protein FJ693_12430 [Georgenia yuyongxinii]